MQAPQLLRPDKHITGKWIWGLGSHTGEHTQVFENNKYRQNIGKGFKNVWVFRKQSSSPTVDQLFFPNHHWMIKKKKKKRRFFKQNKAINFGR